MQLKLSTGAVALMVSTLLSVSAFPKSNTLPRTDNAFVCGTGAERELNVLATGRYHDSAIQQRMRGRGPLRLLHSLVPAPVQTDSGDLALIQDDGTMISEVMPFNLGGKSFRFEPAGSGTYRVMATPTPFAAGGGTSVTLSDDDTFLQNLGFSFPYYGTNYSSVQLNSDGNLTFSQADTDHTDREIGRFTSGPPRIGPLFVDLDPSGGGTVSVLTDSDGVLFVWEQVPNWDTHLLNSFSVKLFKNGNIEFVYGTVASQEAIVGISPGNSIGEINAVDFAKDLPTGSLGGTIAEIFANQSRIVETNVARAFFKNHPDSFDQLIMFLGFDFDLGSGAFAYEVNVKNDVDGIALEKLDTSALWGSNGRLRSFVDMGSLGGLGRYPTDPTQVFLGSNSTISILGQEAGHRFLAFTPWRDGSTNSNTILGRDLAHWSFFFNSDASVMEGNLIKDSGGTGNTRFVTIDATTTYNLLDQYIMGLVGKEAVPGSFVVENPTGTSRRPYSNPAVGVFFGGSRRDVTIDSIIAANGTRAPSVYQSPKVFRQAFILLTRKGQTPTPVQIAKVQRIRDAWVTFFNQSTGGRGWSVTDLQDGPGTTPTQILFPYFQGDSQRYTGIAVANWGSTPADVFFTMFDNNGNQPAVPSQIINPRVVTIGPGAQMAMLAEQIHGLALSDPRNGWIQAKSSSSQVTGFFLDGDIAQTLLNGAVAGNQTNTTLYFTRAQVAARSTPGNSYKNLIDVVNPNATPAQLTLKLLNDSGTVVAQAAQTLAPKSRLARDLPSLFPAIAQPLDRGYVVLSSDQGVVGYQSIDSGTTLFSLPAQAASTASKSYSAQFASGNARGAHYFTELNLVNTSSQNRVVQVLLVGDNGTPVNISGNPATVQLPAGSEKRLRGESLFGLPDAAFSSSLVQGSLALTADGAGVIGDVLFGDAIDGNFLASLPLDGNPVPNMVLSQVAQGSAGGTKPYYTGIALYNPNADDASVTIDVYSEQGAKTGTVTFALGRGNRISKTLPELVPAVTQQARGYVRISSSAPIVGFELFGDQYLSFLAPVPPQPITP